MVTGMGRGAPSGSRVVNAYIVPLGGMGTGRAAASCDSYGPAQCAPRKGRGGGLPCGFALAHGDNFTLCRNTLLVGTAAREILARVGRGGVRRWQAYTAGGTPNWDGIMGRPGHGEAGVPPLVWSSVGWGAGAHHPGHGDCNGDLGTCLLLAWSGKALIARAWCCGLDRRQGDCRALELPALPPALVESHPGGAAAALERAHPRGRRRRHSCRKPAGENGAPPLFSPRLFTGALPPFPLVVAPLLAGVYHARGLSKQGAALNDTALVVVSVLAGILVGGALVVWAIWKSANWLLMFTHFIAGLPTWLVVLLFILFPPALLAFLSGLALIQLGFDKDDDQKQSP